MEKILFVMQDERNMTEPMNLMLLSALAKQNGRPYETELVVLERDDIAEAVKAQKPSIVAFSAIMGSHKVHIEANARVKAASPSVKTIIGGPYATFRPQLINEHDFDAVGIGECDDAWPQLLDEWAAGRSGDDIPNIVTQGNATRVLKRSLTGDKGWKILPEHLRDRKTNLDDLPFMDRGLIYDNTAFRTRYKRTSMAGRGCPFRCTYCFEHAYNDLYKGKGRVLTRHSVMRLCAELAKMKRDYDTRFIKFYDDVFPVFSSTDDDWLEEFAEVYPREVGLPFHCLVRAEQVNEQSERKLNLLKRAGIASLTMSIESGNAFSRDYVLIRDMRDEDLRKSFAIARRLGIWTFANTILAVPNPTLPDVHAPDEVYQAQLKNILTIASEVDPKRNKRSKKLADRVLEAQTSVTSETERRKAVDTLLREVGVRAKAIDYDKESVYYNMALHVSFGEYPVFFPYEGTQLGDYSVRHGAFDGDYDKLHASYQTASPLDCFSEHDKMVQQNLALLGTALHLFAGSYNPLMNALAKPIAWLAVEYLSELPLTGIYVTLYSAWKNYMHQTRVYPMGHASAIERTRNLWQNLVLDVFKQFGDKKVKKPKVHVGQTLGGSLAR
jgi:radical SAM superfamily enzyme YgiQ (UPF0313 family)